MKHVIAKEELDNLKLRISPVKVRMADGSIRMMNHAELLPLYYLIPEEILSKCGVELNRIERILSVLLSDPVAVDIVESDLFMLCIMDCYAYMAWFYLCPDIPFKEIFSVNEPSWRLAQAIQIWINELFELNLIPTFYEYYVNRNSFIPFPPIEAVSDIMYTAVTSAVKRYNLQPIIDTAKEYRCFEDFDDRNSNQKIDFYRKWYHTRTKHPQISLEGYQEQCKQYYDDIDWEVPDPISSFEEEVELRVDVNKFLSTVDDKDKQILQMRAEGYTTQEIADRLGYKTHSAVVKRIKKLGRMYQDFSGLNFGFE